MADPTIYVESLERRPRKGGIKTLGPFRTLPRLGAAKHIEWDQADCGFPVPAPGLCWGFQPDEDEKETRGYDRNQGPEIFGLYMGVECWLGQGDYEAEARAVLEGAEHLPVEEKLVSWAAANATPGGAGLAGLENAADANYPGEPVILMNRGDALRAAADGTVEFDREGNIWTANGTRVVATSAVPAGIAYALGSVTIFATPITAARAVNPTVNREMAIAERIYGIAVDCSFVVIAAFVPENPDDPEPGAGAIEIDLSHTTVVGGEVVRATVTANAELDEEIVFTVQVGSAAPTPATLVEDSATSWHYDFDTTGIPAGTLVRFSAHAPGVTPTHADLLIVGSLGTLEIWSDPPSVHSGTPSTITVISDWVPHGPVTMRATINDEGSEVVPLETVSATEWRHVYQTTDLEPGAIVTFTADADGVQVGEPATVVIL